MPLYMDRHDLPGVTAEDVAQAHARDLGPARAHGVQFLTYWYDGEHGAAFCLANANAPGDVEAVHRESHGLIPNEIISVSEDNVLRFLGRIHEPADHTEITSPFRTILFTDLEDSTAILQKVGEAAYMVLLTEHDLIIRRALVAWRGHEVKHTGDGIMAAFDEVGRALQAALAIEDGFAARAAAGEGRELRVRVGMAAGEPVDHNDDLFGSTVNLAARICQAADGGQILVSEAVRDLGVQQAFEFREADPRTLKGFAGPTRVFELLRAPR
jgi:class 3 adenylate cyclase